MFKERFIIFEVGNGPESESQGPKVNKPSPDTKAGKSKVRDTFAGHNLLLDPKEYSKIVDGTMVNLFDKHKEAKDIQVAKDMRQKIIKKLKLPQNATDKEIEKALFQDLIKKLKLPQDATREDIQKASLKIMLKKLKLPQDGTLEDIRKFLLKEVGMMKKAKRQKAIKQLYLPQNATDKEIVQVIINFFNYLLGN